VLSVSAECGSFSLPACNDDQRPGVDTNARVWVHPAVGTLYVLVSVLDGTSGPYEVRFTTSPVAPNECGAGSLDLTPGGTAIGISVPPSRVTGTCMADGTTRLAEAAFHFDGGRIDRLRAYTGYTGYLHVRSSCDLADEERCVEGTPIGGGATVTETNVRTSASRLHVFLDGASSVDQVYALFVEP